MAYSKETLLSEKCLVDTGTRMSTEEILQASSNFIVMLKGKVESLQRENEQLKQRLDESEHIMSVETYAVRHIGKSITSAKAGGITRRMHNTGLQDSGKCVSLSHPGLESTLWTIDQLQQAFDNGWFKDGK